MTEPILNGDMARWMQISREVGQLQAAYQSLQQANVDQSAESRLMADRIDRAVERIAVHFQGLNADLERRLLERLHTEHKSLSDALAEQARLSQELRSTVMRMIIAAAVLAAGGTTLLDSFLGMAQ